MHVVDESYLIELQLCYQIVIHISYAMCNTSYPTISQTSIWHIILIQASADDMRHQQNMVRYCSILGSFQISILVLLVFAYNYAKRKFYASSLCCLILWTLRPVSVIIGWFHGNLNRNFWLLPAIRKSKVSSLSNCKALTITGLQWIVWSSKPIFVFCGIEIF